MAKKNFKDVTGIKFADLIMPLVMGGIGSYSPAAGRGVGLGLQAFRTFQAGQAFSDEREEKKEYKEWASQQAENAQAHLEQLRQGKIDPSQVATSGFHSERGPAMPVGGGEVEDTPVQPGQISLFGDDGATVSDDIDLDRGGEISGAMGSAQDMITESILGRKRAQDAAARDIELAQQNVRFSQAAMHTAPSTGAYMTMQDAASKMSDLAEIERIATTAQSWETSQKNKFKLDAALLNMRNMNEKELALFKSQLNKDYPSYQLSGGQLVYFDKERISKGMSPWVHEQRGELDPMDLTNMGIDDRLGMFARFGSEYNKLDTISKADGLDDAQRAHMKRLEIGMNQLWASVANMQDFPMVHEMLQQYNAQLEARGIPPITKEQWLEMMGVTVDPTNPGYRPMSDKDTLKEAEEAVSF